MGNTHTLSMMQQSKVQHAPGAASEQPLMGVPVAATSLEGSAQPCEISEVQIEPVPFSTKCLSVLLAPFTPLCCCGMYTGDAKTEVAVLHMGQLTEMQAAPGLHCAWPVGQTRMEVSTKRQTMELPTSKIADATGNPVMVSAILNYRVVDAKKALLHVENRSKYVNTNAQAVLKQTVSQYSYEQLKGEHEEVNERMRVMLQPLMVVAGVEINSFCLNDLSYAPEGHCTITAPSLHHHCTITAPSLYCHRTITAPSLYHHCTITVPSLYQHCTITAPSPPL